MLIPATLSLIALLGINLEARIVFAIVFILTMIYAYREPKGEYFKLLITAATLSALACFMQKEIVYASLFLSFFYELRKGPMWNIGIFTCAGVVYFTLYDLFNLILNPIEYLIFISLAGALSASLIDTVKTSADKRVAMLIAVATTFAIFKIYIPSTSLESLAIAFFVSFILSLLALKARIADESGLMSATIVGTVTILFTDLRFFAVLLLFYLVGSITTKYKYSLKLKLGVAEPSGGARGFSNVFGNSLAPLFFAMQFGVTKDTSFAIAFIASVATALGDTMASEIGKIANNVYLITNFKKVRPGTSGGISVIGEISAFFGCIIVFLFSFALGLIDLWYVFPVVAAAFLGIHVDSLLGATLEQKSYLNNSAVNFLATLFSGFLCYLLIA
ncbi:MAG: TIGR00297 family protein [Archaeoglobaceae archaeon]